MLAVVVVVMAVGDIDGNSDSIDDSREDRNYELVTEASYAIDYSTTACLEI